MDTLFLIIWLLSLPVILVFLILAIVQFMKKDKIKGKNQLKFAGISTTIMIVSFIAFMVTLNPAETPKNEKIETVTKSKEETPEEKATSEAKNVEEQALTEQTSKDETETQAKNKTEEKTNEVVTPKWQIEISKLVTNTDSATDKFYSLEKFFIKYDVAQEEVEQFSKEIVSDYKSGTYLSEIENHERMLTNILKSYYVEKNSSGAIKDFAFDYLQNMKYTYRGVDTVDSDSVKSNEEQMNKALKEIK
ncbi:hypothetical protein KQI46_10760 [Lysinibacillus capsici]|uniref:hypothetical protein n=1 Tax=Lysinibacillus capsici TaxID=2115968 RepID=UPI001C101F51|nr:hypothetical protein [Lysinibacillus capsici]MBU5252400.1 hypothetical protein [Lysinibacillus capsici]